MSETTCVLPDKPSELIRLALGDLRKCENDPIYTIDMGAWHEPMEGTCYVCLAGAVMAQSKGYSDSELVMPFHTDENNKYVALNYFREGRIYRGLGRMGFHSTAFPEIPEVCEITPYGENPAQFHTDMESLAALLERHGL